LRAPHFAAEDGELTVSLIMRFSIATKDAHGLYQKFGFQNVEADRFLEIKHEGV
jgi:hypothetical protein